MSESSTRTSRNAELRPGNAFRFTVPDVPLGEFDLGGVLYHANYFHLYEQAREALLREIGVPYPAIYAAGSHLVVAETRQEFFRPLQFGARVGISLWAEELRRTSVELIYELKTDPDGASVIHRGSTTLVYVTREKENFRPAALPDTLKNGFSRHAR